MENINQTNEIKKNLRCRLTAGLVFVVITTAFVLLHLAEKSYFHPRYFLGVCGFKQRFGLPCPGCGWTHSAQAFATGNWVRSFRTQPAAAVFCLAALTISIFALHTALFGLHWRLQRWISSGMFWKKALITALFVILLGWLVTFLQAMAGNGDF